MQPELKLAQPFDPLPHTDLKPCRLRCPRPRNCRDRFTLAHAFELAQNFARRRIHRHNLRRRDM